MTVKEDDKEGLQRIKNVQFRAGLLYNTAMLSFVPSRATTISRLIDLSIESRLTVNYFDN